MSEFKPERYCFSIDVHDNKRDKLLINDAYNASSIVSIIDTLNKVINELESDGQNE